MIYHVFLVLPITLRSLVKILREDEVFDFSRMGLQRLLPKIGFTYQIDNERRGLLEQPHISSLRATFLRQYMKSKEEKLFDPVFLDETWIFGRGSPRKSWHDDHTKSIRKKPIGQGKRYV